MASRLAPPAPSVPEEARFDPKVEPLVAAGGSLRDNCCPSTLVGTDEVVGVEVVEVVAAVVVVASVVLDEVEVADEAEVLVVLDAVVLDVLVVLDAVVLDEVVGAAVLEVGESTIGVTSTRP